MPPPCGSAEGTDRDTDSVGPSGRHFVWIDAGQHTEEGEVALDIFMQLLEGNGGAQFLVEVGLVSGKLHMGPQGEAVFAGATQASPKPST